MDWQRFSFDYTLDLDPSQLMRLLVDIDGHREAARNLILPRIGGDGWTG